MKTKALACTAVLAAAAAFAMPAAAATPENVTAPVISGTAIQGHTLTTSNGTWSNKPTSFTYRWQRCTANGTGCTNIDNAVNKTYTLTSADVNHTVQVLVTAKNADGQATANSRPTNIVASTSGPKNVTPPSISGTPAVGETLTTSLGTWSGGVRTYSIQWQTCDTGAVNCTDVAGATGKTYGVRASDVGNEIRVKVTARSASGVTTVVSNSTGEVTSSPGSTVTTSQTVTTTVVNKRPTLHLLRIRVRFGRVYATYRVCDDSGRHVTVVERDSRSGVRSSTRRWSTNPQPCKTYRKNWRPASRFHGTFVVRLYAVDYAGLKSKTAKHTFR